MLWFVIEKVERCSKQLKGVEISSIFTMIFMIKAHAVRILLFNNYYLPKLVTAEIGGNDILEEVFEEYIFDVLFGINYDGIIEHSADSFTKQLKIMMLQIKVIDKIEIRIFLN